MPSGELPTLTLSSALVAAAQASNAWPFEEARKIVARIEARGTPKDGILFATGYGPS